VQATAQIVWEVHRCIPCGGAIEAIMIELGVKRR
jgi:hypothetical protein